MNRRDAEAQRFYGAKRSAQPNLCASASRRLKNFSAVLLAGGKSSRMGRDKAFLEIDRVPLWLRQIETLRALSPDELFISGPPLAAEWRDFEIVADVQPNAGPLGGIAAALQRCRSDFLVVLAVDMPRMNAAFLRSMLDDCVAANDGRGIVPKSRGGYEPLAAVYPKSSLPVARGC